MKRCAGSGGSGKLATHVTVCRAAACAIRLHSKKIPLHAYGIKPFERKGILQPPAAGMQL